MVEPDWQYLLSEQVRQNSRLFYQLAIGIVRDDGIAQDVCQHAFTQAWEHRGNLDRSGRTLKSWISRTVLMEALQRVRRDKIERRVLANHATVQPEQAADPQAEEELREAILMAVAALPEPARSMIKLKYLDGLPGEQIRVALGCSKIELWREIQRAFELLREQLSADWRHDHGE